MIKSRLYIVLSIISAVIIILTPINSLATDSFTSDADDFINTGREKIKSDNTTVGGLDQAQVKGVSDYIYNVFLGIGVIASVAIGLVLGIKFVTSGVEEKAKVKEALIAYLVGCMVIFGSYGIWKLAIGIFTKLD